jgi:hypothetical protein
MLVLLSGVGVDVDVRSDERHHNVDRCDLVASDLRVEKLWKFLVYGRCRQRHMDSAIGERRKLDPQEFNRREVGAVRGRGMYVKHRLLRRGSPETHWWVPVAATEALKESYDAACFAQGDSM